ncbi:methylenetetrahydrofolate reductase C-terminal domain-containing protein [archaeon]|nr:methylenetetrahydrofolate reductase C-terminal domain-containing protein [archaeon]
MIIVETKKIEELAESLAGKKKVLIVGCNGCVGIHQQGGERQAEELAELFKLDKVLKNVDTTVTSILRQCDKSIVKDALTDLAAEADAILSMACGAGVQVVAESFDIPALPAHNTSFIGVQERESETFYERCVACGNCILHLTGGICPVTRCPKSHMNGPCGGLYNGKCETDKNRDCAWILIYNRLKALGELDRLKTIMEPKDFSKKTHPRSQEA